MNKKFLFKTWLLLALMVLGVSSAWADDYTTVATFESGTVVSNSAYASYSNDDWMVTFGGNNVSMGTNSKKAASCKISQSYGTGASTSNIATAAISKKALANISRITFVHTGGSGNSGKLYLAYSTDNTTWNAISLSSGTQGDAIPAINTKVTFDFNEISSAYYAIILDKGNATAANFRFDDVVIEFQKANAPAIPAVATIGVLDVDVLDFGAEGTFNPTITPADGVTSDDYTVTWDEVDEAQLILTENGEYIAGTTKGSVDVTVHVTPVDPTAYEAVSKTFTVKVKDPYAHSGLTQEDAFTVAEAIEAINNNDYESATEYYVSGIVSSFYKSSITGDGTNYRYYISDDGLTTTQLLVYKGTGLNQTTFGEDDLLVGDEVIVKGTFTVYQNTPEINSGNYLVYWNRPQKAEAELSFAETEFVINLGDDFIAPTLSNPNNLPVVYSSSNEEVAMVDDATGEVVLMNAGGSTTITATFSGNNDYKASSASYTLTVVDPNAKGTLYNPYTVAEVIDGTATGTGIYVKGFIVGEYVGSSTAPKTSGFSTDANIAIADAFTTNPTASASIPVQLGTNSLKTTWGCNTTSGSLIGHEVIIKGNVESYFSVNGIKSTTEVSNVTKSVTVTAARYATLCADKALDFTGLEVKAYQAAMDVNDGNVVTFTEVTKVPAGAGVLLKAEPGEYEVPVTASADELTDNILVGVSEDGQTVNGSDSNFSYYVLRNQNENVGFYKIVADGYNLKKGTAYLKVAGSNAKTFIGFDGTETAVEAVAAQEQFAGELYNLQGQRVGNDYKGIVIVNGKKVIR